jgi:rRNA maturation RNase YbeY
MSSIRFFTEGIKFKLKHQQKTTAWINKSVINEGARIGSLSIILCSDHILRNINLKYLKHDTFTDTITFDYADNTDTRSKSIEGDIFISVDRVKANSKKFLTSLDDELHRVIIHGVLHLLGYSDKTARKKSQMRKKEDAYLSLR